MAYRFSRRKRQTENGDDEQSAIQHTIDEHCRYIVDIDSFQITRITNR